MAGSDAGIEGAGVGAGSCLTGSGAAAAVSTTGWEVAGAAEAADTTGSEVGAAATAASTAEQIRGHRLRQRRGDRASQRQRRGFLGAGI